jgi:hypothetical protein
MESSGQMNLDVDFGGGRQANIEFGGTDQLWISAGPGFSVTDLWLKAGADMIDVRVRVRRIDRGIEVVMDRGEEQQGWWNPEAAPRLAIAVDLSGRTARAVASVGDGQDFQEVILGQTGL